MAECSRQPLHLVFLDWAKAFDRVRIPKLIRALERMSVPEPLIKAIKALYRRPRFVVKLNGKTSDAKEQQRGIRQGCPLSPYLFAILMHVIVHDANINGAALCSHKIKYAQLMYADDVVLFGKKRKQVQTILNRLEETAARYGLRLNGGKCAHMHMNTTKRLIFNNGQQVPLAKEVV